MKCFKILGRRMDLVALHIAFLLIIAGGCVTWLSYNPKNILGIVLVFSGFALYALAGLYALLKYFRGRIFCVAVLALSGAAFCRPGDARAARVIPEARADSLASRQVIYQGRVIPYSCLCNQLTRKLTGKNRVGGANDVQFVSSMVIFTEDWMNVPFIKVKGRELRRRLGMKDAYIAPVELYDSVGDYRLGALYENGESSLNREILEVDEKMGLLGRLMRGTLFTPLAEGDSRELSAAVVALMMAYDRVQPWRIYFMYALTVGILGLLLPSLFGGRKFRKLFLWLSGIGGVMGICSYIWTLVYMGRAPLVGNVEIMLFMAMIGGVIAFALCRGVKQVKVIWCVAEVLSGGFAMAGWVGFRDAMVSPLMPALNSPWLSVHVSVIMTSYVLLALTLPAGIALIINCKKENARYLKKFCFDMLHPGVYLLGIGIITGSVWANTAWGRYWGWDPKETWALITWLLYALPLHLHCFPRISEKFRESKMLGIYLILPFLSILMTYFGVAYLPSLHSYQ